MITKSVKVFFILVAFVKFNYKAALAKDCGPPPLHTLDAHDCCQIPSFIDNSIMDECGVADHKIPLSDNQISCGKLSCMFKKINIMHDDEKVDIPAITSYFATLKNPDWTAVTQQISKKCFLGHMLKGSSPACQPLELTYCIALIFFTSCPAKRWNDSTECSDMKKYLNDCFVLHPPSSVLH